MVEKHYCKRCGNEIKQKLHGKLHIKLNKRNQSGLGLQREIDPASDKGITQISGNFELCLNCYKNLEEFMAGKTDK